MGATVSDAIEYHSDTLPAIQAFPPEVSRRTPLDISRRGTLQASDNSSSAPSLRASLPILALTELSSTIHVQHPVSLAGNSTGEARATGATSPSLSLMSNTQTRPATVALRIPSPTPERDPSYPRATPSATPQFSHDIPRGDASVPAVLLSAHGACPPAADSPAVTRNTKSQSPAPPLKSWASVAAPSSLSQFSYETSVFEGKTVVSVPDDIIDDSPLWDSFLVGRFAATAPHIAKIHVIVNKIWTLGDKSARIDVFVVNDTTVKFRIVSPQIRKHVLRRGMWNICEIPLIVSKWSPIIEEAQPAVTSMPMWIKIKQVPHSMYSWKGLGFLTSPLGKPLRLHQDTLQVTSFDEAKVFVDVDLTQELPTSTAFLLKGQQTTVTYEYLRLPPRCGICGKWGHSDAVCLATKSTTALVSPAAPSGQLNGNPPASHSISAQVRPSSPIAGTLQVDDQEKLTTSSPKDLFSSTYGSVLFHTDTVSEILPPPLPISSPRAELEEGEVVTGEETRDTTEEPWQKIHTSTSKSATKSPPPPLIFGQVTIASPSRYAILSTLDEGNAQPTISTIDTSHPIGEAVLLPAPSAIEAASTLRTSPPEDHPVAPLREILPRSSKKQSRVQAAGKLKPQELLPGAKHKRAPRKH